MVLDGVEEGRFFDKIFSLREIMKTAFHLLFVIILFESFGCGGKPPANGEKIHSDGVYMGGKDTAWPLTLGQEFKYKKSQLESAVSLDNGQGGLVLLSSDDNSKKVYEYYLKQFKKESWKILLDNHRPSEGKQLLDENPELAQKAGLNPLDQRLPYYNYILIGEGKLMPYKELGIVTVSIISSLKNSQIRLYYKKIPKSVKNFDGIK